MSCLENPTISRKKSVSVVPRASLEKSNSYSNNLLLYDSVLRRNWRLGLHWELNESTKSLGIVNWNDSAWAALHTSRIRCSMRGARVRGKYLKQLGFTASRILIATDLKRNPIVRWKRLFERPPIIVMNNICILSVHLKGRVCLLVTSFISSSVPPGITLKDAGTPTLWSEVVGCGRWFSLSMPLRSSVSRGLARPFCNIGGPVVADD